eukprot:365599-Chlamydomonas_euryale.AAC.3
MQPSSFRSQRCQDTSASHMFTPDTTARLPTPVPGPPPDPSTVEACKPKEYRDVNRVVNSVNPGTIEEKERWHKRASRACTCLSAAFTPSRSVDVACAFHTLHVAFTRLEEPSPVLVVSARIWVKARPTKGRYEWFEWFQWFESSKRA